MQYSEKKEVALFVTCLIDNLRPDIAFSTISLLEEYNCSVVVPESQTCCGQPNYNGGDKSNARRTARSVIDTFLDYEYVVIPSGSCGAMIKHHYEVLLDDDKQYTAKARQLSGRVFELSSFLVEVLNIKPKKSINKRVTYHDACAGLRELNIKSQPRQLIGDAGAEVVEMDDAEVCCGFGGMFCVKYPDISNHMADQKVANIIDSGADAVATGDLGCLMNIEGKLHRAGHDIPVYHFAELLAGEEER